MFAAHTLETVNEKRCLEHVLIYVLCNTYQTIWKKHFVQTCQNPKRCNTSAGSYVWVVVVVWQMSPIIGIHAVIQRASRKQSWMPFGCVRALQQA